MNDANLKKFVNFTKDLLESKKDNPEFSWFIESFQKEIVDKFFKNITYTSEIDKFKDITESDIGRVKSYLNFIDRKAYNYGRVFYKDIKDDNLKKELIDDFRKMKIALKEDNIVEFGRQATIQLERIFNHSLYSLDVHNLILNDRNKYERLKFNEKSTSIYNMVNNFFDSNNYTNTLKPRELSRVSFTIKSIFLTIHFKYFIEIEDMNDLYFLRNKGSHGENISQDDLNKLNLIINNFDKNYSYYHKVLFDVVNGIKNI